MRKPAYRPSKIATPPRDAEAVRKDLDRALYRAAEPEALDERLGGLQSLLNGMFEDQTAPGSPVLLTYELIGDRWIPLIIFILGMGTFRHTELLRTINVFSRHTRASEISQRILTLKLRKLETYDLISHTVWPSVPPRSEYKLTEFGHSFHDLLTDLVGWSQTNSGKLLREDRDAQGAIGSSEPYAD